MKTLSIPGVGIWDLPQARKISEGSMGPGGGKVNETPLLLGLTIGSLNRGWVFYGKQLENRAQSP